MSLPHDACQAVCTNAEKVVKLQEQFIDEKLILSLTDIFKALSDPTRARIIYALTQEPELCVCDLSTVLGMSVSSISHQLRLLRDLRLVKRRKVGKTAYYSLDDDHVVTLFRQGLEHARHQGGANFATKNLKLET